MEKEDTENDADYILEKTINLRIFEDEQDKMNLSLLDIAGEMMVVSQFTLLGDCVKGTQAFVCPGGRTGQGKSTL